VPVGTGGGAIEFDKELAGAIQDTVREISKGIKSLQGIFDKSDWAATTESAPEQKPEQPKPATKRKPRAKKPIRGTVLKVIKQNQNGISRKELLVKTGFSKRQILDCVYQLKKLQKIEATKDGLLTIV
jgi:hypothetical protein